MVRNQSRRGKQPTISAPVQFVAIAGLSVLMFGTLLSMTLWGGGRRGVVLGTASGTDTDKDGIPNAKDRDDDNDGLVDPDDPLPTSHGVKQGDIDLDNDGLPNSRDTDDDGDLKVDTADFRTDARTGKKLDLSLDYNNNLKLDHKERHVSRKHDLDRDGIPDVREMIEVCRAAARERGIPFPEGVESLAEVPAEVLRSLPANWHFGVVHDKNNNGIVDGLPQTDAGQPRDYTNYLAGGVWADAYLKHAADPKVKDVIRCLACDGTEIGLGGGGGSLPFFTRPAWSKPVPPGFFSRVFGGKHSPYKDHHAYYGGKHSKDYGADRPQFVGGEYVNVAAAEGGAGAAQGTTEKHDGSWYSHVFVGGSTGEQTGGTGGDAGSGGTGGGGEPYSGGGGGHMTMGGGGGGYQQH